MDRFTISLDMNIKIEDALRPLFQTQKYSNTLALWQKLKPILSCFIDNGDDGAYYASHKINVCCVIHDLDILHYYIKYVEWLWIEVRCARYILAFPAYIRYVLSILWLRSVWL